MIKKVKHISLALVVLAVASGCAKQGVTPPNMGDIDDLDLIVYENLENAISASGRNLDLLRRIKQSDGTWSESDMGTKVPPPNSSLHKLLTLQGHGPIENMTSTIASRIGYTVSITGKSPAQPVMVSVVATDKPAYEIIENLGWQAGEKVAIVRDDKLLQLKIIYKEI